MEHVHFTHEMQFIIKKKKKRCNKANPYLLKEFYLNRFKIKKKCR